MLSLEAVTKRFGTILALDQISLNIEAGEFFGLLGPNGAGKSTLMSLIAGLRAPDSGALTVNGKPLSRTDTAVRSSIGFAPQSLALYAELTAEQNLRCFGKLYGLRGEELNERIEEVLAAVELTDRRRSAVRTFSGGMQRRLNLAASLLHRPHILLCDEPTVGVDPQSRNAIFEYLQKLNAKGVTVLYSTHYMEEAARLCSRIGIIDHGKLLALGSLDDLLMQLPFDEEISFPSSPAHAALATALASCGEIATAETGYRFRPRANYPLSSFFAAVENARLPSRSFEIRKPTLEAVFLHLTGRTLRD